MAIAYLGYKVDSSQVAKAEKRLDGMSGAAGVAAKAAKALTIAVGAMFAGGAVIREISTFETSMSRVGAISRATAGELAAMRDVARDLGSTTEFSASQAADGLGFLAMAGFEASEAIAAIPAVLDLATASGMQLASAADIASNVMSGFGIEAANAADVADVLAAASSRANTSVSQLGRAMSTVAPISAALGVGIEDTAAAIGVMSDAGIQGERAGTALRGVLASLAGPTDQARDALAQYGITLDQVNPETNSLADIMALLAERGISTADAMTVFGREAASGALVMVEANDRLREFGDELGRVDGAASDMAGTMRDNLGGDIKGLQSAVSGLILTLGDAGLTAVLRGVVHIMTQTVRAISGLVDAFSSLVGYVSGVIGLADATRGLARASSEAEAAMAGEAEQAAVLLGGLVSGRSYSVDYIGVKLAQAEAHLAAADAIRQENKANIESSEAFIRAREAQAAANEELAAYYEMREKALAMGEREGEFELSLYTGIVERLQRAVETQRQLLDGVADIPPEVAAINTEIDYLRGLMNDAVNGVVVFNEGVSTGVTVTNQLAASAGGIDFSGAIAGAQRLSAQLGVSLQQAMIIMGLVGGISRAPDAVNLDPRGGAFGTTNSEANRAAAAEAEARLDRVRGIMTDIQAESTRASAAIGSVSTSLAGGGSRGGVAGAASDAADTMTEAEQAAQSMADTMRGYVTSAIDNVADAFGDFVSRGFSDFKGFASSIIDTFKNMLSQMIALAARNTIMVNLGLGGVAGGIGGGGLLGNITGGIGGFLGNVGSGLMSGLSSTVTGFTAALGQGAGFMGAIGSGFSNMISTITGGIGAGGLAGISTAIGAAIPIIGGVAAAFSFFKKRVTQLDSGIIGVIDGLDATISTFETIRTSRFWGLSKKTTTSTSETDAFDATIGAIQGSVAEAARVFGYGADLFDQFSYDFKLSLKGLSEEDALKKIQDELQLMGDGMAALVPNFEDMNSLISAANEAVAETYALGSTRFEAEMLAAARRRGEINLSRDVQGVNTPESRLELVEENTAENNRLMKRLTEAFEGWQYSGFKVIT